MTQIAPLVTVQYKCVILAKQHEHAIVNVQSCQCHNNSRNSVLQMSHSNSNEFVIIMYTADHIHAKWAQLAPFSIQYQASGTEELFNWHAART